MSEYEYPLPVTRGKYLTEVGGHSDSLKGNQIGLHIEAIKRNTRLSVGDKIIVDSLQSGTKRGYSSSKPIFTKKTFFVKSIESYWDERTVSMSREGRAVLPLDIECDLREGDEIVLNSAINLIPSGWLTRFIKRRVEDTNF